MSPRSILTGSTAALGVLLIAGCGVFAPESLEAGASSSGGGSPTGASAVESADHSTGPEDVTEAGDDPGLADGAVRPEDTTPGPQHEPDPVENSAPLPAPDDLSSELMVAPSDDQQGSVGQPRGPHAVPDQLWGGQVPVWAECTDEAALAANAGHQPAGWPAGHKEGDPLPSPECHPDFIEMLAWEHYDEFMACCEGPPNGTTMLSPDASEQRVYEALWNVSQERADWSPGDTEIDNNW